MPITLEGTDAELLPREMSSTIMKDAFEQAVAGKLQAPEPLALGDNIIPVYEGGIEAGVVGEGERKPVSDAKMSTKNIKPIKLAAIVVVSKEAVKVNPGKMLDNIQGDLTNAITRAVDLGIFHGRNAKTGERISDATYVDQTANRIELDPAGKLGEQLIAGYELAGDDFDPNGFAFDKRIRPKLIGARDAFDRPVFQATTDLKASIDNLYGLPTAYGKAVSGRVGAAPATDTLGYIGDFTRVRWGYAETISVARSDQATIVDGDNVYHLFQQNMTALLVEAIVGWTVTDVDAFAAYDKPATAGQ